MALVTLGAVLFVIVSVLCSILLRRYQACNKRYIFPNYCCHGRPVTDYKIHSHRFYYTVTLLPTDHNLHINSVVTQFRVSFFVLGLRVSSWRLQEKIK